MTSFLLLACPIVFAKGIQSATSYVAGRQLSGIVIADFNNDGRPDVLVIESLNSATDTIHVLLTNADGTLGASIPTTGGGLNLSAAVAGDFDKDGNMDVAVVDSGTNTLTIFLGKGDGTFTQGLSYQTGKRPMGIAAADLNHDGILDLVVANENDNSISSFLGIGAGAFALPSTSKTGTIPPTSVAIGNLDHDGKPDVAVASQVTNQFGVLPGLGDGSFASIRSGSYSSVNVSGGVAIADLDGDGNADLIFSGNPVSFYRGKGDLTFQNPVLLDSGGLGGESVSIADLNGDGHDDVVVSKTNSGDVSVILSDGHGGFLKPKYYAAALFPAAAAVADLHGDHKLDIITVSSVGGSNVQVIRGNGDGSMQGAFSYDFKGDDIDEYQAVADFDGDGLPDIAIVDGSGHLEYCSIPAIILSL